MPPAGRPANCEPSAAGRSWKGGARERADDVFFCLRHKKTSEQSGLCSDVEGTVKIDILKFRKGIGEPPNRPSGRRCFCAVRAFCRRQNLGAGGIHFRRAFESPKGGGRLRRPEPTKKDTTYVVSFFVELLGGFELPTSSLPSGFGTFF